MFGIAALVFHDSAAPPGSTVPEPGTVVLLATGLPGLGVAARRLRLSDSSSEETVR